MGLQTNRPRGRSPGRPASMLVVASMAQLDQLSTLAHAPGPRRVRLSFPSLPEGRRATFERELNATVGACGCSEGAAALLAVLAPLGALTFVGWPGLPHAIAARVAVDVVLSTAAAALGKLAGQWRARLRLTSTVRRLRAALSESGS